MLAACIVNYTLGERTTPEQIGRRMGVSASTVSRLLNGRPGVNEETRSRVLSVARRRQRAASRLLCFLMPADAETWGKRTNFTEEGQRAMDDVADQGGVASLVGYYDPGLAGERTEDRMIAGGEIAPAPCSSALVPKWASPRPSAVTESPSWWSTACFPACLATTWEWTTCVWPP